MANSRLHFEVPATRPLMLRPWLIVVLSFGVPANRRPHVGVPANRRPQF